MCVHPEISQKHGVEQTACCQALVAAKSCSFHNELQRRKGPSKTGDVPHPDRGVDPPFRQLPDIEDFVSLAVNEKLCPFHWARELQVRLHGVKGVGASGCLAATMRALPVACYLLPHRGPKGEY